MQGVPVPSLGLQEPRVHQFVQGVRAGPRHGQGHRLGEGGGLGGQEGQGTQGLPGRRGEGSLAAFQGPPEGHGDLPPLRQHRSFQVQPEGGVPQLLQGGPEAPGLPREPPAPQTTPHEHQGQGQAPGGLRQVPQGLPLRGLQGREEGLQQLPGGPGVQLRNPKGAPGTRELQGHLRQTGGEQMPAPFSSRPEEPGGEGVPEVVQHQKATAVPQGLRRQGPQGLPVRGVPDPLRGESQVRGPSLQHLRGGALGSQGGPEDPVGVAFPQVRVSRRVQGQGGLPHPRQPPEGQEGTFSQKTTEDPPSQVLPAGQVLRTRGQGAGTAGLPVQELPLPAQPVRQQIQGPALLLEEGGAGQVQLLPDPFGAPALQEPLSQQGGEPLLPGIPDLLGSGLQEGQEDLPQGQAPSLRGVGAAGPLPVPSHRGQIRQGAVPQGLQGGEAAQGFQDLFRGDRGTSLRPDRVRTGAGPSRVRRP